MQTTNSSAIIESGGKQYWVAPGRAINVEKLPRNVGDTVEIDRVLVVTRGDQVLVGAPLVEGAKVIATVAAEGKAEKVIAFKYKNKVRYRRKKGHRQPYTRLSVTSIETS